VIAAGLLILLAAGGAPAADRATVVAGLQAWLDGTSTLEMRFRQTLVSSALGTASEENGRIYLERPGKLRFDYLEPDRKVALLIGDRTELYIEDGRELTRGHVGGEQSLFPRLLSGRDRLEDLFRATLVATPTAGGAGRYRLRLTPKTEAGSTAEVTLDLAPAGYAIEGAEMLDEAGNRTAYVFSDRKRNKRLPVGVFAFEPPPGTEVVDTP
jgi:outer membrane lipoprotein carrier protein